MRCTGPAYLETKFSDPVRHAFLRRVMNPSFSPASLKGLEPTVDRYIEQLIKGVGIEAVRNDGIVEMNKWFHNFSFDVRIVVYWH